MKHSPPIVSILFLGLALGIPLTAQVAVYAPFGTGCPGRVGTPQLTNFAGDLPGIGTTFTAELSMVPDSSIAFGILGLSNTMINGAPLPIDLGIIGIPGCTLYIDSRRQTLLSIAGERALWDTVLPADPSFLGQVFYQQALVVEDIFGGGRFSMSNAALGVVGVLPDLVILSGGVSATPDPVIPGGTAHVSSFAVMNQGLFPAIGVFHAGIYLSTDSTITNTDTLLDSVLINGLVPGLAFPIAGRTVTIPSWLSAGNYWIGFLADRTNVVAEMDETNNSLAGQIRAEPLPDLIISSGSPIVTPDPVLSGMTLTVPSYTVRNQGFATAGNFLTGIFLSTNATISVFDTRLSSDFLQGLAQGRTQAFASQAVTIPAGTPAGTYWIGILADWGNGVPEMDETNNYVSRRITVLDGRADLVITSGQLGMATPIFRVLPFLPAPLAVGNFTVQNQGGVPTGPFTVGYYRDSNGSTSITADDALMTTVSHPGLAPGESFTFPSKVLSVGPLVVFGWHWFGILVDNTNVVDETNELNNWRSRHVLIIPL